MRFKDSPDLFGAGFGQATHGDFTCEMCGVTYNEGADENEDYDNNGIGHTTFAGKGVCENCFEAIERSVFNRMEDILRWYAEILRTQRNSLENKERLLREVAGGHND